MALSPAVRWLGLQNNKSNVLFLFYVIHVQAERPEQSESTKSKATLARNQSDTDVLADQTRDDARGLRSVQTTSSVLSPTSLDYQPPSTGATGLTVGYAYGGYSKGRRQSAPASTFYDRGRGRIGVECEVGAG